MVDGRRTRINRRPLTTAGRWVLVRKAVQALALIGFLALIVLARRSTANPELINLPLRLDPLVVLANLLASRSFLAGSAVALSVVLLTLVAGTAWCGWL